MLFFLNDKNIFANPPPFNIHRYTWILPVEVQLLNQVGAGKMGCVYKAEWKGFTVAVKKTVCTVTEAVRFILKCKNESPPGGEDGAL